MRNQFLDYGTAVENVEITTQMEIEAIEAQRELLSLEEDYRKFDGALNTMTTNMDNVAVEAFSLLLNAPADVIVELSTSLESEDSKFKKIKDTFTKYFNKIKDWIKTQFKKVSSLFDSKLEKLGKITPGLVKREKALSSDASKVYFKPGVDKKDIESYVKGKMQGKDSSSIESVIEKLSKHLEVINKRKVTMTNVGNFSMANLPTKIGVLTSSNEHFLSMGIESFEIKQVPVDEDVKIEFVSAYFVDDAVIKSSIELTNSGIKEAEKSLKEAKTDEDIKIGRRVLNCAVKNSQGTLDLKKTVIYILENTDKTLKILEDLEV